MSFFRYVIYNNLSLKSLMVFLFFQSLISISVAEPACNPFLNMDVDCKEIDISYEVVKELNTGAGNTIKIDLKEGNRSSFIISLVGPKKFFIKDADGNEIKNLSKGTYSLIIVGRDEYSDYCPKQFQVIIE